MVKIPQEIILCPLVIPKLLSEHRKLIVHPWFLELRSLDLSFLFLFLFINFIKFKIFSKKTKSTINGEN